MDFSNLVDAVNNNDRERVSAMLNKLSPMLIKYLRIRMNADQVDAEDCAQQTILQTLESIEEDNIRDPERIYSYILTICKNFYLKMVEPSREFNYEDLPDHSARSPDQISQLINEDKQRILEYCMEQLSEDYRLFIEYWFDNPGSDAQEVAGHFDISVNNAWTRKHRVIKMLNECVTEKMQN